MKRAWPVAVVIAAVLLVMYFADRAFQSRAKLMKAQAAYDELKKVKEADHAIQQGIIAERDETIAEKDKVIGQVTKDAAHKQAEIDRPAALVAQPVPPSTPDVEALPTVIALRERVTRLEGMFTLATAIIADRDKVIDAWAAKYAAQVDISTAWRKQYENERALRIAAEGLAGTYRSALKVAKTWRTVALIAGAAAAASIITR